MLHGLDALVSAGRVQHDGPIALTGQQQRRQRGPPGETEPGECVSGRVPFCTGSVLPDGNAAEAPPHRRPLPSSFRSCSVHSLGWPWRGVHRGGHLDEAPPFPGDAGRGGGLFRRPAAPGGKASEYHGSGSYTRLLSILLHRMAAQLQEILSGGPAHRGGGAIFCSPMAFYRNSSASISNDHLFRIQCFQRTSRAAEVTFISHPSHGQGVGGGRLMTCTQLAGRFMVLVSRRELSG